MVVGSSDAMASNASGTGFATEGAVPGAGAADTGESAKLEGGTFAEPFACSALRAGTAEAGAGEAASGVGAFAGGSLAHDFGFLRLATPSGGFGVTSARHEERAATTPWSRTSGKYGGGTRIARRPMNSIGVMSRWVLPRRGVFMAYEMRPSFSSSMRPRAKGGRAQ
jgi:hypothetical protein